MATINIYEGAAKHSDNAAQETGAPSPSQADAVIQGSQSSTAPVPQEIEEGSQASGAETLPVPTLFSDMSGTGGGASDSNHGNIQKPANSAVPSPTMQGDASLTGDLTVPAPVTDVIEASEAQDEVPSPTLEPGVENEGRKKSGKEENNK